MKHAKIFAASALAASLLLSGCAGATTELKDTPTPSVSASAGTNTSPAPAIASGEPTQAPAPQPVAAGTVSALLETLAVKPADESIKYDRDLFGEPWEDIEGNGCDTRNDMLLRDLKDITVDANECTVLLGTLVDPYSGKTINFDRSKGGGGGIDIDHLVALSAGFRTGAASWPADKKLQFANDPLNLLSSASGPNRAKGDKDASEWLPGTAGNPSFNCKYVARQVAVKAKYGAWVTPSEKTAIVDVLTSCPEEPVPSDQGVLKVDVAPVDSTPVAPAEPAPVAPAPEAPVSAPGGAVDPDYGSCTKAKAAGAGPYTTADPEYKFYRDGDGDGTVCE